MSDGLLSLSARLGGVRWEVRPEYRDLLLGGGGIRLDEWLRTGQARVVKQGPHRIVYRLDLPGLCAYLKHYRLHDVRAQLRECVRPSKARMECERALEIAARGLPTIEPLALGEFGGRLVPGDSFLVTRTLGETEPLHTFLEQTLPKVAAPRLTRLRQLLARALAVLLARMHQAGVRHNDLHAGNLLVRLEADDQPTLFLIDLHAVTLSGPLSWRACRANLAMLNRWFVLRSSRSDRLRFWRTYSVLAGISKRSPGDELCRDLEERTWQSNLQFWRQRDRRCLATNRYYRRLTTPHLVGHAVADLPSEALAALISDPDEPFRQPGAVLLKDSPSSTVTEFDLPVQGTVRRVIYKRFRVTACSDPWTALVRRTPALRSWVHGQGLRERLLPTPRPLAVLQRRRRGFVHEGYLLTEKVENARTLRAFVDDLACLGTGERGAGLRSLVEQVARLVRELHHCQLSHRDLKAANLLVEPNPFFAPRTQYSVLSTSLSFSVAVWFIDLVGVTRHQTLSVRRRVQNLARLSVSFHQSPSLTRTDRLRFLRVYLQWGLLGRESWKDWWRQIEQAILAKIARNARTGRPLA